ncbi:MAG: MT-A70 family methyltransferase [Verrucomicrobiota bacterium]
MTNLSAHPDTAFMPRIEEADFKDLKRDIQTHGQREPIIVFQGKIVDGRERYRACQELNIVPKVKVVKKLEGSVEETVISLNFHRRHLTLSQRAMIAARLTTTKVGANQSSTGVTQGKAAKLCGISPDSLQFAKKVLDSGSESLEKAVSDGRLDVKNAAKIAADKENLGRDLGNMTTHGLVQLADATVKKLGAAKLAAKKEVVEAVRKQNVPLKPTGKRYGLIYADPAWDYMGEAKVGYPTMKLRAICKLPVAQVAENDAVLALWVPPSLLADGLKVIKAWGFEFKTSAVWDKERPGLGQYFGNQHEILMLATRGNPPRVPKSARHSSVLREARPTQHSRKPQSAYAMIEGMYEGLSKLELFARGTMREGWEGWGNQCQTNQPATVATPEKLPKAATAKVVKGKAANDAKVVAAPKAKPAKEAGKKAVAANDARIKKAA